MLYEWHLRGVAVRACLCSVVYCHSDIIIVVIMSCRLDVCVIYSRSSVCQCVQVCVCGWVCCNWVCICRA